MDAERPTREGTHRWADYLVTAAELVTVLVAVGYVLSGSVVVLIVWEALATAYLLTGSILTWRRSITGRDGSRRSGTLDTLS